MNQHFRSQINETLFTLKISACGFNIDTLMRAVFEQLLNKAEFFFYCNIEFWTKLGTHSSLEQGTHILVYILAWDKYTLSKLEILLLFIEALALLSKSLNFREEKNIYMPCIPIIYIHVLILCFKKILIFQDNNWRLLF